MKMIVLDKPMTEDEYFLFEEKSMVKHELINGNLYEMSGVSIFHNDICGNIFFLMRTFLKDTHWKIGLENFKVKTPEGNYFYPDIMICENKPAKYYAEKPVLIIEVLSETTRKFDLIDKFIQYQKFETLEYYLCVEPEQQVIIFNYKTESGEWMAETFTKDESVINLPKLNISFTLKEVYHS